MPVQMPPLTDGVVYAENRYTNTDHEIQFSIEDSRKYLYFLIVNVLPTFKFVLPKILEGWCLKTNHF